jgi:nicotinamide phosphoribosyltransferase
MPEENIVSLLTESIIEMTDSYKVGHWKMYPKNTEVIFSYFEARNFSEFDEVMFFGLQYLIKATTLLGQVITEEMIDEAECDFIAHFGNDKIFNRAGWEHILYEHGGKLPLRIRAIPEGTMIPKGNVLFTIENTCPDCYWLTSYIEPVIVRVWYPCAVATIGREIKKVIKAALERSGTDTEENLLFKFHDFGARGSSSRESARIAGAAHLVNFLGSDTLEACKMVMKAYGGSMPGFSIAAAEHSTVTSFGKKGEAKAYKQILEEFPDGVVAVVSDSYDIKNAVENIWGGMLKDKVLSRDGILVIRSDSGDPCEMIPALLGIVAERFGYYINKKGFRCINDKVRIIQSDGMDRRSVKVILDTVMDNGWSVDCIAFGCGGGIHQNSNRDTIAATMKCSWISIDEEGYDVYKEPASGMNKASKRGRLKLIKNDEGMYSTVREDHPGVDQLITVFENGELVVDQSFEDIRERTELE